MSARKINSRNIFDAVFEAVLPPNARLDFGRHDSLLEAMTFGDAPAPAAPSSAIAFDDDDDATAAPGGPEAESEPKQKQQRREGGGDNGGGGSDPFSFASAAARRRDAFQAAAPATRAAAAPPPGLSIALDTESAAVQEAMREAGVYAELARAQAGAAERRQKRARESDVEQYLRTTAAVSGAAAAAREEQLLRLAAAGTGGDGGDGSAAAAAEAEAVDGARPPKRRVISPHEQLQLMLPSVAAVVAAAAAAAATAASPAAEGTAATSESAASEGTGGGADAPPAPAPASLSDLGDESEPTLFAGKVVLMRTLKNYGFIAPEAGGPDIYFALGNITFTFTRYALYYYLSQAGRRALAEELCAGAATDGDADALAVAWRVLELSPEAVAELERGDPAEPGEEEGGETPATPAAAPALFPPITAEEKRQARRAAAQVLDEPAARLLWHFLAQHHAVTHHLRHRADRQQQQQQEGAGLLDHGAAVITYSSCVWKDDAVSFQPCYNSSAHNNGYLSRIVASGGGDGAPDPAAVLADSKTRLLKALCVRGAADVLYCNRMEQAWFWALPEARPKEPLPPLVEAAAATGRRGAARGGAQQQGQHSQGFVVVGSKTVEAAAADGEAAEAAEAAPLTRYTGTIRHVKHEERHGYIQCDEPGEADVLFAFDALLFAIPPEALASAASGAGERAVAQALPLVRERLRVCYSVSSRHAQRAKYTATLVTGHDGAPLHAGNCVYAEEPAEGGGEGRLRGGRGRNNARRDNDGAVMPGGELVTSNSIIGSTQQSTSGQLGGPRGNNNNNNNGNRNNNNADYDNEVLLLDDDYDML